MKYVEEVSISIHALLAESDPCAWYAPAGAHISIHALLAESDTDRMFCSRQRLNFYPRSPCGERPSAAAPIKLTRSISIHALLAESDFMIVGFNRIKNLFLSTLSLRRATQHEQKRAYVDGYFYPRSPCGERPVPQQENGQAATISIHALLAESDERNHLFSRWICYFYPRSPCGERQAIHTIWECTNKFLSTLSLRRATILGIPNQVGTWISIHALLAESDLPRC